MNGKLVGGFIVLTALLAGGSIYYLQEYAFYQPVAFDGAAITLTNIASGQPEPIPVTNLQGIDATSSPLRFRACFTTTLNQPTLTEGFTVYDKAVPLNAPTWFDCFDAARIGAALETGEAIAFLGQADIAPQIDRVVAVFANGQAFAWHQLNPNAKE